MLCEKEANVLPKINREALVMIFKVTEMKPCTDDAAGIQLTALL